MAAHRYWKILPVTLHSGVSLTALYSILMRETVDGPNLSVTGNGTAFADAYQGTYTPDRAFLGIDSAPGTIAWRGTSGLQSIGWDFGAGAAYDIKYLTIWSDQYLAAPDVFRLQWSDDGSVWTTFATFTTTTQTPGARNTFFYDPVIASANITAPIPIVTFFTGSVLHLSSQAALCSAYCGSNAALLAPSVIVDSYAGGNLAITAPSPTLYATAHDSTGENAITITAPSPTLTIRTGANAQATAPSPTLSASGTVTILAKAALAAPSPTLTAAGTVSGMAAATLTAPSPNLVGYGGAVCSVTLTGSPTLVATGTTGGVGSAQVTCPLFQLSAGATAQNRGSANLLSPSPRLGAQAQAWLTAPSARLTAIGTAVVTATYEAYAVNLKHSDPNANDETTHYTNFPFTHVARYKNSYYGANSTGLYLLEGTTDNGAPIPWAFETAITDFKSPNKKTLAAAYFSGRFGTSSTIQLKKGEKSPITHAFTTPRGTLAQNHRQVFGKDRAETRTRYFALAASGTSEFELDAIECDVHNTARRI